MNRFFIVFLLILPLSGFGQTVDRQKHKVVFQLTSSDTLVHKALVRQVANLLTAAPNSRVEVVCHSNGIEFLTAAKTRQAARIRELKAKGVDFVACENTLQERKMKKEDLLEDTRTVPAGVLEVVAKQEKGWAYLKAGF
jgi:intracellular sulfur oxidation DsrE/DsrF family protein